VFGRKLSEEHAAFEERATEAERKLSDLTSQISGMIQIDAADALVTYSAERTVNAVSQLLCFTISLTY